MGPGDGRGGPWRPGLQASPAGCHRPPQAASFVLTVSVRAHGASPAWSATGPDRRQSGEEDEKGRRAAMAPGAGPAFGWGCRDGCDPGPALEGGVWTMRPCCSPCHQAPVPSPVRSALGASREPERTPSPGSSPRALPVPSRRLRPSVSPGGPKFSQRRLGAPGGPGVWGMQGPTEDTLCSVGRRHTGEWPAEADEME